MWGPDDKTSAGISVISCSVEREPSKGLPPDQRVGQVADLCPRAVEGLEKLKSNQRSQVADLGVEAVERLERLETTQRSQVADRVSPGSRATGEIGEQPAEPGR